MEKLVADNLVKFIGVSNFNLKELQEAEQALENERIACNQVLYHLGYRAIEKKNIAILYKQGIAVLGYVPFGYGAWLFQIAPKERSCKNAYRHGENHVSALNFFVFGF